MIQQCEWDEREIFMDAKKRMSTLHGELNEASSFAVRVDGMTGEEDRVLPLCWFELQKETGKY